jgi:hypothetical protein
VLLCLDCLRPEARLEEVSDVPVPLVEAQRVEPIETVHALGEIRFSELEDDVVVVGHQAVGETDPVPMMDRLGQNRHEQAPVLVVEEDRRLPDAARREMHDAAGWMQALGSSHRSARP